MTPPAVFLCCFQLIAIAYRNKTVSALQFRSWGQLCQRFLNVLHLFTTFYTTTDSRQRIRTMTSCFHNERYWTAISSLISLIFLYSAFTLFFRAWIPAAKPKQHKFFAGAVRKHGRCLRFFGMICSAERALTRVQVPMIFLTEAFTYAILKRKTRSG